jgi:hypothetical protein
MGQQNSLPNPFSDSPHPSSKFPYYPLSGGVIFKDGTYWDQDMLDYVDRLGEEREEVDIRLNQLHKTDWKVVGGENGGLKDMLKDKKKELNQLVLDKRDEINECADDIVNLQQCERTVDFKYDREIELCKTAVQNMERVLNNHKIANSKDETAYIDVEQVKDIPITDYVDFNRSGFANCIWHNEKTPSMKYYKKNNRVHCFGCGVGGDVIDVVMALNDCDMKEALKTLSGKPT